MSLASQSLYNALIRRSIDLRRLCQVAAQQVAEPGLRVVLQENAAALELLVLDLQMELSAQGGRPATLGRWSSPLQRRLAGVATAQLVGDDAQRVAAVLGQVDDEALGLQGGK